MKGIQRNALLSTTALAGMIGAAAMLAAPTPAHADCTPDPAVDGDTVTCTGTDVDGFQASALNLSLTIELGASIDVTEAIAVDIITTSVLNFGSISATGKLTHPIGIKLQGGDVGNSGSIDVIGQGTNLEGGSNNSTGIHAGGTGTVTNSGTITVSNSGDRRFAWGISSWGNYAVNNSGSILVDTSGIDGTAIGIDDAENGTMNSGTISASVSAGTGGTAYGFVISGVHGSDYLLVPTSTNTGTIEVDLLGTDGLGAGVKLNGGAVSFQNDGQILLSSSTSGNTIIGIDAFPYWTPSGFQVINASEVTITSAGQDNTAIGLRVSGISSTTNSGVITVNASAADSSATGIEVGVLGNFVNQGSIVVDSAGTATGIFAEGGASSTPTIFVSNSGSITVTGNNATGIHAPQSADVTNEVDGSIQSDGVGVNIGLDIQQSPHSAVFTNHGSVISVSSAVLSHIGSIEFSNDGLLRSTGDNVEGAVVIGNTSSFENLAGGVIEAVGASSDGVVVNSSPGITLFFKNYGTISGTRYAYRGGDANVQFSNFGQMIGDVLIGSGNDLILKVGSIDGTLDLGPGGDRIVFDGDSAVTGDILGGEGSDRFQAATYVSPDVTTVDLSRISGFEAFQAIGAGTVIIQGTGEFQLLEAGGRFYGGEDAAGHFKLVGANLTAPNLRLGGVSADDTHSLTIDGTSSLTLTSETSGIYGWANTDIINAGSIISAGTAIKFDSGATLDNSGSITAQNIAVEIASWVLGTGGSITNSGTIIAPVAVIAGSNNDTITNTGSIIGDLDGGGGFDTIDNGSDGSITGAISNFESISNSGSLIVTGPDGLNLGGDLTLTGTSELVIQMNAAGPTPIQVGGAATLTGALAVDFKFSSDVEVQPGDRFIVLDAVGGVTGTFDTLDLGSNLFIDGSLVYSANGVELELVRSSFMLPFFGAGRRAIARQLDGMAGMSATGIAGDFIRSLTFTERRLGGYVMDQLASQAAADLPTPVIEARHGLLSHVSDRLVALGNYRGIEGRWVTSVTGFGEFGDTSGTKYATGGAMAVTAYGVNDRVTVGFAMAGTASDLNIATQYGDNGHKALDLVGFASYRTGEMNLSAMLGGSYDEADTERAVIAEGFEGRASGRMQGAGYSAAVDAQYALTFASIEITPRASFRVASFHHGSYEERELGNLGLQVEGRTITSLRSSAGVNLKRSFGSDNSMTFTPELGAYYEREFGDRERTADASFIANPTGSFPIFGEDIDANRTRLTAGFTARFNRSVALGVHYETALGNRYDTHRITGGLRVAW